MLRISHDQPIVVAGSGMAGLTAAILLARLGRRVTLVEKRAQPGGLLRSYRRGGLDCPVGIHYLPGLGPGQPLYSLFQALGVMSCLDARPMGLEGPIDRYHLGGRVFDLPRGLAALDDALRQAFPGRSGAVDGFLEALRIAAAGMADLGAVLSPPDGGLTALEPAGPWLASLGAPPEMIRVLGMSASLVGASVEECPRALFLMTLAGYVQSPWRLDTSGRDLAQALADSFVSAGGELLTGREVTAITAGDRGVTGVELAGGEHLEAGAVISTLHPKLTLALLPGDRVGESRRGRILALRESPSVVGLQAALPAAAHPALAHNVYLDRGTGDESNTTFLQLRETPRPDTTLLTVLGGSSYGAWAAWENTRTGKRGPEYREAKEREADRLLAEAGQVLGSLEGAEVLDVFTPLTLRDWASAPRGGAYGVLRSAGQALTTAALLKGPVRGLYLAGQSILAPGVLGAALGAVRAVELLAGAEETSRILGI